MSRDLNGDYTLPSNTTSPATSGTTIDSSDFNETMDDIETALDESVFTAGTSGTDNAVIRADGASGKKVQESSVSIDDSGNLFLADNAVLNYGAGGLTLTHVTSPVDALEIRGGSGTSLLIDGVANSRIYLDADNNTTGSFEIVTNSDLFAFTNQARSGYGLAGHFFRYDENADEIYMLGELRVSSNAVSPYGDNGASLGTTTYKWSDLFLAPGAVINFDSGNVTLEHSSGVIISNGAIKSTNLNGAIQAESTFPAVVLSETDGTSTHNETWFVQNSNAFSLQTRQNDGTFVVSDYTSQKTATGSQNHRFYIQGSDTLSMYSTGVFSKTHGPITDDGAALGTTSFKWSDLFLASGAVINFNSGDVELTHSANALAITGGSLGIGATPAYPFEVTETSGEIARFRGGNSGGINRIIVDCTTANQDSGISFMDAGSSKWTLGNDGDSDTFAIRSGTGAFGSSFDVMRIASSGNVMIGGTAAPASATKSLSLFNGTAPTGSVTNGVVLYSEDVAASAELKVRDEAGNITTLSPHNFELIPEGPSEGMAWSYYSERDGKAINIDMLKAIRVLEKLSGEKLVYEAEKKEID